MQERIAGRLRPVADGDAHDEKDPHGGEDRPPLALVADHAAEDVGQRRPEREDRDHLDEIRERRRVLEGMGRVALKKPPPLVPSILIATWLATGPTAIVCLAPSIVVASI